VLKAHTVKVSLIDNLHKVKTVRLIAVLGRRSFLVFYLYLVALCSKRADWNELDGLQKSYRPTCWKG
jgi:hypothetical protein